MNKLIKTNIIIQIITLLILIYINHPLAEDNKEHKINDLNKKAEYIKQNCKIGKKYFVKDNKKFIKKILIGEWAALPHSKINFMENGKFVLIYQMKNKQEGEWDIGRNCILLKFKGEKNYHCIEIEYYILSNYDSTYIFEIVFKNDHYWGSELYLEFN